MSSQANETSYLKEKHWFNNILYHKSIFTIEHSQSTIPTILEVHAKSAEVFQFKMTNLAGVPDFPKIHIFRFHV